MIWLWLSYMSIFWLGLSYQGKDAEAARRSALRHHPHELLERDCLTCLSYTSMTVLFLAMTVLYVHNLTMTVLHLAMTVLYIHNLTMTVLYLAMTVLYV